MKRLFNILMIMFLSFSLLFVASCEFNLGQNKEEKDLEAIYQSLFEDVDTLNVTEDLRFKTFVSGVRVSYESNNPSVISNTGKVTRPEEDTEVEVKITLSHSSSKYVEVMTFVVLKANGYVEPPKPEDELTELKAAIAALEDSINNFKLTVTSTLDGEVEYVAEYYLDDDKIRMIDTYEYDGDEYSYDYYVTLEDGMITSFVYEYNDEYYIVTDPDDIDEFLYYTDYYLDYYSFSFSASDFTYQDGVYVVKENLMNTVGKLILGDFDSESTSEEFTSFTLTLKDGLIYKVEADTIYSSEGDYSYHYELVFEGFGLQEVIIPDAIPEEDEDIELADVYYMEKGDEATVGGFVVGSLGQNIYISDGTASLCVYFTSMSYIPEDIQLGDYLSASGTVDIFNGLYEVKVASAEDAMLYEGISIEPDSIDDVSQIDSSLMSYVINLENVKLESKTVSSTKDTTIVLTDSYGNTISFFVKKANAALFEEAMADIDVSKNLMLNNVVVSVYKTNVQLMITEQFSAQEITGLFVNPKSLNVSLGTTLNEVLEQFSFQYIGDVVSNLNLNELTYETSYDGLTGGSYEIVFKYEGLEVTATVKVVSSGVTENASYDLLETVAKQATTYSPGLPSTGDVNVLVIPIAFTNSPNYDLSVIETAFNGENSETGWYSLSGYYKETSYGVLNIHANVLDPYQTNEEYNLKKGTTGVEDYKYFLDAITYYDEDINYAEYDQNDDGYIDCVYLIYLAPYMSALSHTDLWWAYCYEYFEDAESEEVKFDGIGLDWYLWASYEFFNEPIYTAYDSQYNVIEEECLYVKINCETIIHETGHALGLDDYYDYNDKKGPYGGLGAFVMMDTNQGDHDPFSKAILGWINPTVVYNAKYSATLRSFTDFGDAIFIMKDNEETYFTEMYVIALYTPTKANELKCTYECGLPSISGVAIFHVDAVISDNITDETGAIDIYKFNNGSTEHKLIKLIEADGHNDIEQDNYSYVENDDLFQANSSYELTWYDGSNANIVIEIGELNDTVQISIKTK